MITIGAYEAKTHLSSLLEKVAQGEEVIITKHGKAVARLVPVAVADLNAVDTAITQLKALRTSMTLDGISWRELRDAGRR